jgi:hypothetical protein
MRKILAVSCLLLAASACGPPGPRPPKPSEVSSYATALQEQWDWFDERAVQGENAICAGGFPAEASPDLQEAMKRLLPLREIFGHLTMRGPFDGIDARMSPKGQALLEMYSTALSLGKLVADQRTPGSSGASDCAELRKQRADLEQRWAAAKRRV